MNLLEKLALTACATGMLSCNQPQAHALQIPQQQTTQSTAEKKPADTEKTTFYAKQVEELEEQLRNAPQNPEIPKTLATASYELARLQWKNANEQLQKTKGQYSPELQQQYITARDHAQRALDITLNGDTFPGIEERIGQCYLIVGTAYVREANLDKSLDNLRKGFPWGGQETKDAICMEIFTIYRVKGLENIVQEFSKKSLKEALVDLLYTYCQDLKKQGKGLTLLVKDGEECKNALTLFGSLGTYALQNEKKKPAEERDPAFVCDAFFSRCTLAYTFVEDQNQKPALVGTFVKEYASLKRTFPNLTSIYQDYYAWSQGKENVVSSVPDAPGLLLEAFEKREDY